MPERDDPTAHRPELCPPICPGACGCRPVDWKDVEPNQSAEKATPQEWDRLRSRAAPTNKLEDLVGKLCRWVVVMGCPWLELYGVGNAPEFPKTQWALWARTLGRTQPHVAQGGGLTPRHKGLLVRVVMERMISAPTRQLTLPAVRSLTHRSSLLPSYRSQ